MNTSTSAHTASTHSAVHSTARARGKTKVVVRKLPHNLSEEEFKKTIESYLPQINFYYYQPGKKTYVPRYKHAIICASGRKSPP
jgi:hypothetical protein